MKQLLQRQWFAALSGAGGEFLASLNYLTLSEVKTIRATDQWIAYIEAVQGLLQHPLELDTRGKGIFERYIDLARVLSHFAGGGYRRQLAQWQPALTIVLTIGTAVIQAVWNPLAPDFTGRVEYSAVGDVAYNTAAVVARLIIGGVAGLRAQAELEMGIDFMRAQISDAKALWKELQGELGIKQTHELIDYTAKGNIYDPNINYEEDFATIPGAEAT